MFRFSLFSLFFRKISDEFVNIRLRFDCEASFRGFGVSIYSFCYFFSSNSSVRLCLVVVSVSLRVVLTNSLPILLAFVFDVQGMCS